MNILLCESHYRSRSWIKALNTYSELYILSVMPEEYNLLIKNNFDKNKICNLNLNTSLKNIKTSFKENLNFLNNFEKQYKVDLNSIVLMDRTLRTKSYKVVIKYMFEIINREIHFLEKNNIKLIFMEPTWFHEIVLCKIAKFKCIPVYAPVRDKLMDNKFYFFKGYSRNMFFIRAPRKSDSLQSIYNSEKVLNETPFFNYFKNRNTFNFNKLEVFLRILRLSLLKYRNYFIQPTFYWSVKNKLFDIFRKKIFNFILNFHRPVDNEKYILIPLHVQPEAGIDVIGEKFANQLEFVRQVVRTLPSSFNIFVKEHPHDFGRRTLDFYRNLEKIPSVKLIHPSFNNKKLIQNSKLVISVAGTASLEASLLSIPAVTAVKSHFHYLMVQPEFDPYIESVRELLSKSKIHKIEKSKFNEFYKKSELNLFTGNTMDCKTDKSVLLKDNIDNLKDAFFEVIDYTKNQNV